MTIVAPDGYVTAWSLEDRLFHLLMFAVATGWLTDGEVAHVEQALDEERQRVQRLADLLLAGLEPEFPPREAIEAAYHNGRADGFAQGVNFARRERADALGDGEAA